VTSLQHAAGQPLWATGEPHPVLLRAGQSLDGGRLTGPAAGYWAQLTATSDRLCGPHSPATLATGTRLAQALLAAGHTRQAVTWSQWAAGGQTRAHGPSHPDTLAALLTLARAYRDAGRLADAATLLRDTLARCEQALPPGHQLTQALRDTMTAATTR